MGDTNIEWATKVWNPTRGCRRVSSGCEHCYAERQAARHAGPGGAYEGLVAIGKNGPRWTGEARFLPHKLAEPFGWGGHHRVFVDSMSDLFYEGFFDEQIAAVFGVMAACPQHDFLVLTKRIEQAADWFRWVSSGRQPRAWCVGEAARLLEGFTHQGDLHEWPLPNVWLGVSVEDQATADERIPLLLKTPAAVHFVSAEPLLGRVNICQVPDSATRPMEFSARYTPLGDLDWVIVGGESGPGARPFDVAWARLLVETCAEAGVACFVKQLGARPWDSGLAERALGHRVASESVVEDFRLKLADRKGGAPAEWPLSLRVRQFPRSATNPQEFISASRAGEKQEEGAQTGAKTPAIPTA
jgi:protein gp37